MKNLLKVLSGILAVATLAFLVNLTSYAATPASGTFENYTYGSWVLDGNGKLIIEAPYNNAEWDTFRSVSYGGWKKNDVKEVVIKSGASSIDSETFKESKNLEKVTIPDTVTNINWGAFYNCSKLAEITLPKNLTYLGSQAFYGCKSLKKIVIPDSVTNIEGGVFSDCVLLEDVVLPKNLTKIGWSLFSGCTSLKTIKIPNSVITVESGAFSRCTALEKIAFPDDAVLESSVFSGCTSLVDVTLPKNMDTLPSAIFDGCTSLVSVTIPESVTEYKDSAFSGCTSLVEAKFPAGIEEIPNFLYNGCTSLTNISIPNTVEVIGDNAFSGCTSLTELNLPSSVNTIKGWAFSGCTGLTKVTIPSSVEEIGIAAFQSCEGVQEFTFPRTVKKLGENCFGFYNLKKFTSDFTICELIKLDKNLLSCFSNTCELNLAGNEHTLDTGVVEKKGTATDEGIIKFSCTECGVSYSMKYYVKDNKVIITKVESDNYSLKSITLPSKIDGNDVIGIGDLEQWSSTNIIPWSVTNVIVQAPVEYIGMNAFGNGSITSVTLPDTLKTIGGSCFSNSRITSITIPASVTTIGTSAFWNCEELASVVIPEGVTTISGSVFNGCKKLETVSLPSTITSIEWSAFSGCNKLTSIVIPRNCSIGADSFSSNTTVKVYPGSKAEYALLGTNSTFEYVYTIDSNAKVENLVAEGISYKHIMLTWDPVANATSYEIFRTDKTSSMAWDFTPHKFSYLATVEAKDELIFTDKTLPANAPDVYYYYVIPLFANNVAGVKNYEVGAKVIDTNSTDDIDDVTYPVIKNVKNVTPTKTINSPDILSAEVTMYDETGIALVETEYFYKKKASDSGMSYSSTVFYSKECNYSAGERTVVIHTPFSVDDLDDTGVCVLSAIYVTDTAGNRTEYKTHINLNYDGDYTNDEFATFVEQEFDIEFVGALGNKNVAKQLKAMDEGMTVVLNNDSTSGGILKKEILDAIKGQDKTVVVYVTKKGDMQWVFYGKDITGETKDLDINVTASAVDGSSYGVSGKLLQFDFGENGVLPGKVNFRAKSEYIGTMYDAYDDMHLYYINGNDLETVDADCKVIKEASSAWCYFNLTHNSSYFLSGKALKAKATESTVTTGKDNKITATAAYTKVTSAKKQTIKLNAKATAGTITYKSSDSKVKVSKTGVVTIPKNYVGTVKITLTANKTGYVTANKTVTISVNPTAVTIKSAKSAKKGQLALTWAKNTKATGYEIQYSTDKSFKKNVKTVTVSKASTTSKTITKLTGNKTYYVRVRTYKTVNKTKCYSSWSKASKVKIKK